MKSVRWMGLALAAGWLFAGAAFASPDDRPTLGQPDAADVSPAAAPLVAGRLQEALARAEPGGARALDLETLRAFYGDRRHEPVWVGDAGVRPEGLALLLALQARAEGLGIEDPILARAELPPSPASPEDLAALDILLSEALMRNALGVPASDAAGERARRVAILQSASATPDTAAMLAQHLPQNLAFWRLARALLLLEEAARMGGWGTIEDGPKLEPGMRDSRVGQLRLRLLGGTAGPQAADADLFDAALEQAVRAFQERHGLEPDGVVGKRTLAALNQPVEARIETVAVNLERLRGRPNERFGRRIYVNIPAAELLVIEEGAVAFRSRAIVGRPDRPTPELQNAVRWIELNPYWNVPPRIARMDLLPKVQKDPAYFRSHRIRVYQDWSDGAAELDPAAIDWFTSEAAQMRYKLRQDPGPENAMGPAKFMFPNSYDVYIHGTNNPKLFRRAERAFSSGCIRVEDPVGLAAHLVRGLPGWSRARIEAVVASGQPDRISLPEPMPVTLDYLTAWVDEAGVLNFREDLYGRDRALPRAQQAALPAGRQ